MKKVGLALSSGFVRGLTHIGVLKVLQDNSIPIGEIAGTSMGAVIGASYCCGYDAEDLIEFFSNKEWKELVDFTLPKTGLISSIGVKNDIRHLTKNKYFSETRIPLKVIATDMNTRDEIVFVRGRVANAVAASTAVPGIFSPVKINGRVLVDGGLVNPIPADVLDKKISDVIIAVDISTKPQKRKIISKSEEQDPFTAWLKSRMISSELSYFRAALREKKFLKAPVIILKIIDRLIQKYLNPNNLINYLSKQETPQLIQILSAQHDILMNQLVIEKLKNPDIGVIIKPELKNVTRFEFDKAEYIIKQGEKAAKASLPKIKRLLQSK